MTRHRGRRARLLLTLAALLVATTTGCADAPSPKTSRNPAVDAVDKIEQLPTVAQTVELPRMLSRGVLPGAPTDYDTGWLFHDARLDCPPQERSVSCGAVLEVWGTEADAKARSEYLQALANPTPQDLEWHFLEGQLLLRVAGEVKKKEAEEYAAALRG